MKQNTPVSNTIRKSMAVKALPRLLVEFNHNRYANPTADNTPSESVDSRNPDIFPIASIVGPHRPRRGAVKATVGEAKVSTYSSIPKAVRYHITSPDDTYKYWSSPNSCSTVAPYNFTTNDANPQVTYDTLLTANKIVIGLENSVSSPDDYDIFVQTAVGGAWTKVADETNTTINSDGRIQLWYNGTTWTTTKNLTTQTKIAGIKLMVYSMNLPKKFLDVIEIAACLEKDITDYLRNDDDTFDLGDSNVLAPIGRISSNVSSINLFNALVNPNDYTKGLMFNNDNINSIYYGLLRENAKFTLDYIYDATSQGGTATEVIRQFVMYAEDNWSADLEESVNVSVRDVSKILQEMNAPQTFIETAKKMSVGEVVWRLLDSVGFVDYNIDVSDTTDPLTFDFFWVNNDTKIWEILNSIAEGTQTAIYVDSNGILQVKTKEVAFNAAATPVWHIRGADSGTELADLVSLVNETKEVTNSVKITYRPTDYERTARDNFRSDLMWEPETESVYLHSSDLQQNLLAATTDYMKILAIEATDWPYKGMIQIEGELISYEGKEYYYIDSADNQTGKTVFLKSGEDYLKYLYKTDTAKQYLNRFTGRLKITERGMWNTVAADHLLVPYTYQIYRINSEGTKANNTTVFRRYGSEKTTILNGMDKYEAQKAVAALVTTTTSSYKNYYHAMYAGSTNGVSPIFYGTKLRIRGGQKTNFGGLAISTSNANGAGYYVEVRPTAQVTSATREIIVYAKNSAGKVYRLNGQGWRSNIVKDKWYSIDVQLSNTGTNHYLMVWINGRYAGRATASGTEKRTATDAFGMYIRGSSNFEYEYLYAFDRVLQNPDNPYWGPDTSYYDRVKNGYVANQFIDEFVYATRTATRRVKRKSVKYTQRYATKFYDEFGPVCHEVREFDIKYSDKLPGKNVKLLATNEATAKYMDFRGTPFGAHFYAVNVSHNDTEIHGENEKLGVISQNIVQQEEKTATFEDKASIRVSGKKELPFTSQWVQSEDQANNLGNWITNHWNSDTDEISVVIFGNPLIELTDVVQITDPQSAKVAEKYFVIATSTDFDAGLSTTLRLRKANV